MKKTISFVAIALIGSGCQNSKFTVKEGFLKSSAPVFANSQGANDRSGAMTLPEVGDDGSNEVLRLSFMCSTGRSKLGNLATSTSLKLVFVRSDSQIACQLTSTTLRQEILQYHGIRHSTLINNCGGQLPSGTDGTILNESNNEIGQIVFPSEGGTSHPNQVKPRNQTIGSVVVDYNPSRLEGHTMTIDPELCDQLASPLVVRLTSDQNSAPVPLSSQSRGILFDILGTFAEPAPHTPKQISWFTSDDYAFVSLPNEQGEIRGVDQLFGNNTTGPDGRGAKTGYHALAKYDRNGDSKIDSRDAIYKSLRLWKDADRNGVSSPVELTSLQKAGIVSIDLRYDDRYVERDSYGNETRMKSVVKMRDGSLRLIFDLWFSHKK